MCWPRVSEAQVLDRIEISPKEATAEIHIVFNTRVVYRSHSPKGESDVLQVLLEFPEFPPLQRLGRQVAAIPRSEGVPKFSVIFPVQSFDRTKSIELKFSQPVKPKVWVKNVQGTSILILSLPIAPLPSLEEPSPETPSFPPERVTPLPPTFAPGTDINVQADELLSQAQAALEEKNYEYATRLLNALLNLPPNSHSQLAQELAGVAREGSGEISKARLEYELYLKLYPEGEGAVRVREHLDALGKAPSKETGVKTVSKKPTREIREASIYGTLTEFYFGGLTQNKTTQDEGGTKVTTRDSTQDQSLLLTTADFTGRYRLNDYDNKFVVRGSYTRDFKDMRDMNDPRVRALFLEHGKKDEYLFRLGRQPGNAGGILDLRFDGGWFRYRLTPQYAVNVVGGMPRPYQLPPGRSRDDPRSFRLANKAHLEGINLDFGPIKEVWSGNTYFMNQMVHGLVDRRAVGTELRYFDNGHNGYFLIDYDVYHDAVNIVNFNGTLVTKGRTTFNVLADYRTSPYILTTNALLANGPDAVEGALASLSKSELRTLANALSGTSQLYLIGITHPVTNTWQIGGDVRLNRISGSATLVPQSAEDTGPFPNLSTSLLQLPGSGNIWTGSLQAIGSNIIWENHTLVVNTSYTHNHDFKGQSLGFSSLARIQNTWQIDSLLNFFRQTSLGDVTTYRITPSVRVDYRIRKDVALEGLFGVEQSFSNSPAVDSSTTREFFYFGLRWEK